jgi:hypothetical protein
MRALILCSLLLTGCATTRPTPETIQVPVAVGCLGDLPARPANRYGVGAYPGDKAAAQIALQDSAAWEVYSTGLEAATAGCRPKDEKLHSEKRTLIEAWPRTPESK